MINVFAAPTLVATIFCAIAWGYLTYKNIMDVRLVFSIACFFSCIAYVLAFKQYVDIFYVYHVRQPETAMWLLFVRLLLHCSTALIFCYNYDYSLKRR